MVSEDLFLEELVLVLIFSTIWDLVRVIEGSSCRELKGFMGVNVIQKSYL